MYEECDELEAPPEYIYLADVIEELSESEITNEVVSTEKDD